MAFWVALGLVLTVGTADAAAGEMAAGDGGACGRSAAAMEREYAIPRGLLTAVAIAETGRWDATQQESLPWPWTVRAQDRGRYFEAKPLAVAAVRRLQAQGVRNIDVGCMQVNLQYHPDAFETLEEAFDPRRNADYAARLLVRLHGRTRSWSRAVSLYHSAQHGRGLDYWRRVSTVWRRERRTGYAAAQNRLRETFERARAARAATLGFTAAVGPLAAAVVRIP